jgi:parvulin-like peptidyl-prolyl isomerase
LVKHVLIAWRELDGTYGGQMDARAKARDNATAAELAQALAAKLRADPDQIDALARDHSEDPGSKNGEPPPPDPLEPAKILARPATAGSVHVQHVLIGWRDVPAAAQHQMDPRAEQRSKAEADVLANAVLAKVKAGGAMAELMKQYSEDPGSKDSSKDYEVSQGSSFVEPFKRLSLRLKPGEAAMIRSGFGWHVIKRVAPPPLDPLESKATLRREPVTDHARVKHILLSYDHLTRDGQDPRGTTRTRAKLEALVKKTVAALNRKVAIEPLMAELSEDPGSAINGTSYDVTPDAGLVAPFKALSLRLKVGEVGVVKTDFGFHIIQRTE